MRTTILQTIALSICVAAPASAATISYTALNDNGAGANPVTTQPIGVAAGLPPSMAYDGFVEPTLTNGQNAGSISASNAAGVTMTATEGTFKTAGAAASSLGLISTTGASLDFEASAANGGNGTSQGLAGSDAWGVDTDTVISSASNTVLLLELANNFAGTFSAVLLDLEGGAPNAPSAFAAIYDAAGALVASEELLFDPGSYGNEAEYLFTFADLPSLSTIAFFVGDNDAGGAGGTERIAAADFATFGPNGPAISAVPLPASGLLLGFGILALGRMRRRS